MKNINTHRIGGTESSDNLEEFIYDGKKQNFTNQNLDSSIIIP